MRISCAAQNLAISSVMSVAFVVMFTLRRSLPGQERAYSTHRLSSSQFSKGSPP
jgi:hypothetical protein